MRFDIEQSPSLPGLKVTVETPMSSVMQTHGDVKHHELDGTQRC